MTFPKGSRERSITSSRNGRRSSRFRIPCSFRRCEATVDGVLRFVGTLPHRQALDFAATVRIGLTLYDSDTASRSIVASRKMALGLIVVGTRVPGVSEMMARHDIGVALPLGPRALGSVMLSFARDAERLRQCAAVGRAPIRRDLKLDVQSARLISIYTSLAGRGRVARSSGGPTAEAPHGRRVRDGGQVQPVGISPSRNR